MTTTTAAVHPRRALIESGPPAGGVPRSVIAAMGVSMAAALLAMLDTTIVNVSMHATTARFGDIAHVQWVLTAYLLALCATMPSSAWLVDRLAPKRAFVLATTLFGVGSLLCATSPRLTWLIAARAVAGAGAGLVIPISTVLLTRGVPREQLGKVQALNGSVQLIAPLIGPTLGGLLVEYAGGWSAVYWVNVPVCLLILGACAAVSPDRNHSHTRTLDLPGLVCGTTAIVSSVLLVSMIGLHPWTDHRPQASAAGVLLFGALFLWRQRHAAQPLLNLELYCHPVYSWSSLNVFFLGFILYAPMVVIPLYLEAVRGNNAVHTGLLLSVAGIGVVISGLACPGMMKRCGGGVTMMIGITLTLLATIPLTQLTGHTSYWLLCGSLMVRGAGIGLTIVPAMTRAFESIPASAIADASAQLNLLQRIGGTMAAAILVMVVRHGAIQARGMTAPVFAHASWWVLGTSACTLVPALALAVAERKISRPAPAPSEQTLAA